MVSSFIASVALLSSAATAQSACSSYNLDFVLYFEHEKVTITDQAEAVVDVAIDRVSDAPDYCQIARIDITGHTDSSGSSNRNYHLSAAMAAETKDMLTAKGVAPLSYNVIAKGESEPAIDRGEGLREPLNRRVEISIKVTD